MNFPPLALLIAALATVQILIGGARMLYSIPACALLGIAALSTVLVRWKTDSPARAGAMISALAFCAYIFVRAWRSPVDYLARPDILIVAGALIAYGLTALVLARSRWRLPLFFALLSLGVANAVIGAIQFNRGDQFMVLPWIFRTDKWWRASGFYVSPNHYAGMLEVVALMAISLVCWGNFRLLVKIIIGYAAAICLAGLALSGSRGGYLSFAFGLAIFTLTSLVTWRSFSRERFLPKVLAAVAALILFASAAGALGMRSAAIHDRFLAINDPENMRFLLWHAALEQYELEPIWGTGSGTYLFYGRMFRDERVQADPVFVHNDYLHLLAEYGAVGAALFLLFYLVHVRAGIKNIRLLTERRALEGGGPANQLALQIGAFSSIAAYTVHSAVDFNLHIPANAFLMACVFGFVANPSATVGAPPKFPALIHLAGRVSLIALGIGLLIYALPKFPGEFYAEKARTALRDHDLSNARTFAQKALDHEKRNPNIYYYGGEAMRETVARKQGPPELQTEAIRWFNAGLTQFPQDVRMFLKLGQTYDEMQSFLLAEDQLDEAVEIDPNSSIVYGYYGMHFQMQGLLPDAEEQYERALELDGGNAMARAGLDEVQTALQAVRAAQPPRPKIEYDPADEDDAAPSPSPLPSPVN